VKRHICSYCFGRREGAVSRGVGLAELMYMVRGDKCGMQKHQIFENEAQEVPTDRTAG